MDLNKLISQGQFWVKSSSHEKVTSKESEEGATNIDGRVQQLKLIWTLLRFEFM